MGLDCDRRFPKKTSTVLPKTSTIAPVKRVLKIDEWFHPDGFPISIERREPQEDFEPHAHEFAELVIVTGGNQEGDRFTEASTSAAYLVEHGVPSSVIVQEDAGSTTHDSLDRARALVDESVETVLVVTDPYHALRSKLTAEEVGFTAYVSPAPDTVVVGSTELRRDFAEAAGVAVGRIIGFERLSGLTD